MCVALRSREDEERFWKLQEGRARRRRERLVQKKLKGGAEAKVKKKAEEEQAKKVWHHASMREETHTSAYAWLEDLEGQEF